MPAGGVMSQRAIPAWQRDCGVSTWLMVILKQGSLWIKERPANGIDDEDERDGEDRRVPAPRAFLERADRLVDERRAEVAAHVHHAEDDADARAAELDGDRVAGDAAAGRDERPDAEERDGQGVAGEIGREDQ